MNILYINHYAGSPDYGMEFRPYHLGVEWIKQGHNVRILASSFSHVRAKQPIINGKLISKRTIERISNIEYVWYPTPSYQSNGSARVKNIASFLYQVWRDSSRTVREFKPDVVIASSTYPMDIWVAHHIARKAKAKLIYEVHDLWPLSPIELGGMSPKHPFIRVCQWAEDYAYKHSDAVVSMLPNVHEHMKSHGLDLEKLTIIPNGIVEEDWKDLNQVELKDGELKHFLTEQKRQKRIIIGYTGAIGKPNALEYLLEAAKNLENYQELVFVIVGKGLEKEVLLKKKKELKINNVFFFEPIPKTQIPSLLEYFDIAYIGLQQQSLFRFGVSPNKLIDYMMSGRVILSSIEAGNDPVTDAQCGLTVKSGNSDEIIKGIQYLIELPIEIRRTMGRRGKEYAVKEHTYSVLANRFLEVMK